MNNPITRQEVVDALTVDKVEQWLESKPGGTIVCNIRYGDRSTTCIVAVYLQELFDGRADKRDIVVGADEAIVCTHILPSQDIHVMLPKGLESFIKAVDHSNRGQWMASQALSYLRSFGQ